MQSTQPQRDVALWIGHAVQVSVGLYAGTVGVGWTHIEATFDLGLESLGLFIAAGFIARLLCSFISGRLIAAVGLRTFVMLGVLIFGVSITAHAFVASWLALLIAAFGVGIGDSAFASGLSTYVVTNYNARRLNWLHGAFGVGLMLGPQFVTVVVNDLGQSWQTAYLLIGIAVLFFTALMLPGSASWALRAAATAASTGVGTGAHAAPLRPASMRQTLRLPLLWLTVAMMFMYGGTEVGTGQFAHALFTESRGVDPRTASTWVTLYWGSFAAGRLLLGFIVEQVGRSRLVRLLTMLSVIGTLLIWVLPDPALGWLGMIVTGAAVSSIFPTLTTQAPQRFGAAHTANAIGIQMGMTALGAAILPGIGGYLASAIDTALIAPLLFGQAVIMFLLHEAMLKMQKAGKRRS